jgi:hypothetical protein
VRPPCGDPDCEACFPEDERPAVVSALDEPVAVSVWRQDRDGKTYAVPSDVLAALTDEQRDALANRLQVALRDVDPDCEGKPWLLVREARAVVDALTENRP